MLSLASLARSGRGVYPGVRAALRGGAPASFSSARSKGELLDEIMAWREAFVRREGGRNPTQEDIISDPAGLKLLQEWQAAETQEGGDGGASGGVDGTGQIEAVDPAITAKKEEVKAELLAWRSDFEKAHGRKPTRDDMFGDSTAAELFARYQSFTELDWPAEMRLLLNAELTPPSQ